MALLTVFRSADLRKYKLLEYSGPIQNFDYFLMNGCPCQ